MKNNIINNLNIKRFQQEPLFFLYTILDRKKRWGKQVEIIESVRDNRNTIVKSCHGVGKTFSAKDVVLWFLYTHVPSIVLTTAPSWIQVEKLLWAEITSSWKNSLFPLGGKCLTTQIKIDDNHFAIGISPKIENEDEAKRLTGFHSPNLLVVFDEAAGVNEKLWKIKEALMTSANVRFLGIGNPISTQGSFYQMFQKSDVKKITMSIFDSPNFKANNVTSLEDIKELLLLEKTVRASELSKMKIVNPSLTTVRWVIERAEEWGIESPIFQARVLGEFPEIAEDTIISYTVVEKCKYIEPNLKTHKILGVDVARYGTDYTVMIGYENGRQIYKRKYAKKNLVYTTNQIIALITQQNFKIIVIDDTGLGGGVTDNLFEFIANNENYKDVNIIPINFAEKAYHESEYDDIITELYFNAKNMLEDKKIRIEDEGTLIAELCNRKYKFTNKGKFKIESKDDYKKRTGAKSPDEADAFVLCLWGIALSKFDIITTEFDNIGEERLSARMFNDEVKF